MYNLVTGYTYEEFIVKIEYLKEKTWILNTEFLCVCEINWCTNVHYTCYTSISKANTKCFKYTDGLKYTNWKIENNKV